MKKLTFLFLLAALMILPLTATAQDATLVTTTATNPGTIVTYGTLNTGAAPADKVGDNTITVSASADYSGSLPKTVSGAVGVLKSHEILPGGQVDLSAKLAKFIHLDLSVNYSQKPGSVEASFAGGPGVVFGKNTQFFADVLFGGVHESQSQPKVADLKDSAFVTYARVGGRHFFGKHIGLESAIKYGYSEAFHGSESSVGASAGPVVRF